jgi:uncharacterized protein (TIGR00255 family)
MPGLGHEIPHRTSHDKVARMILSMTGFGSASAEQDGITCVIEVRSVNNRFFKSVIKLPDKLNAIESDVEKLLRESIARGSVVFALSVKDQRNAVSVTVNQPILDMYVERIKGLQKTLGPTAGATLDLATLFTLPGVVEAGDDTEEYLVTHRDLVMKLGREAIGKLLEMRKREGAGIWADLSKHLEVIRVALAQIATFAPNVSKQYHEKLRARVLQMVSDAKLSLSDSDLLKEVALFTDRADISEEIARLGGHLEQFRAACENEEQAGRKLDFIAQEMLREANTIASKANDSQIARLTVDIKSAIDRIKEQAQNVE